MPQLGRAKSKTHQRRTVSIAFPVELSNRRRQEFSSNLHEICWSNASMLFDFFPLHLIFPAFA
jgi:hypothetical protein